MQIILALVIGGFALVQYFSSQQENPITGETQYVDLTPRQEVALGLQAAPQVMGQHGGAHPDPRVRDLVAGIGNRIVESSDVVRSDYPFEFHALADPDVINAFALPGGQVFITEALLSRLGTEGEVAGVLGHEIGHVVGRHGAEHMAKAKLTQGLTGAAVLATYDPDNPASTQSAAVIALVGQLVNMKFGRDDELESDRLGVRYMAQAGYDPRSMIRVMEVLAEAGRDGQKPPEFFSTHPNPERRIERIQEAIQIEFPDGVPAGLIP
jgi:predicted Zn-dependent protease